jgi:hypothetical protein
MIRIYFIQVLLFLSMHTYSQEISVSDTCKIDLLFFNSKNIASDSLALKQFQTRGYFYTEGNNEGMYYLKIDKTMYVAATNFTGGLCCDYFEIGFLNNFAKSSKLKKSRTHKKISNNLLGKTQKEVFKLLDSTCYSNENKNEYSVFTFSYGTMEGYGENAFKNVKGLPPIFISRLVFKHHILVKYAYGYMPYHSTSNYFNTTHE